MDSPSMPLPPGAKLVTGGAMPLPPGAKLVSQDQPQDTAVRDHLKDEGFLDSAWNVIKSPFSFIGSIASGDREKDFSADKARAKELEKNGTPEQRREFAKEYLLKALPGASTIYKAAQGNIAGAAGDLAGMVTLGAAAKGVEKVADAAPTVARVVTNPEVARAALDVVPKGAAIGRLIDKVNAVRKAAQGTTEPVPEAAPPIEAHPAPVEAPAPAVDPALEALAQQSGFESFDKAPQIAQAALKNKLQADAELAAKKAALPQQPPRHPMGPPQAAPVETAPAEPATPPRTLAQQVADDVAAHNGAAPEAPAPESTVLRGGNPVTPIQSRGVPLRAPLRRAPLPTETRAQYEAAMQSSATPQSAPTTPAVPEPEALAPPPRSLAQTEAAMVQKKPAPVDIGEARTLYDENGELKSPQRRGVEKTAANRAAKAQRYADALHEGGVTSDKVSKIEMGRISNKQLLEENMAPRWGNIADSLNEKVPSAETVPQIIDALKKIEKSKAAPTASPEAPVKGTRVSKRDESWDSDYIEKTNAKIRERERQAWDGVAAGKVKEAAADGKSSGEYAAKDAQRYEEMFERTLTPEERAEGLERSFRAFTHPKQLASHWDDFSPGRQAEIRKAFTDAYMSSLKPAPAPLLASPASKRAPGGGMGGMKNYFVDAK